MGGIAFEDMEVISHLDKRKGACTHFYYKKSVGVNIAKMNLVGAASL